MNSTSGSRWPCCGIVAMRLLPCCGYPSRTVSLIVPYGCGVLGICVQLPVRLAQAQGSGAWCAVAHALAIHLRHRHDPARRAGHEDLLRAPHLLGRNRSLFERDAVFGRELDDGPARDALEDAPGRRSDPPVLYTEDVEPGSLDDVLLAVDQDHRLPAAVVGLVEADLQIQPVIVLDGRVHRAGPYALHARDHGAQPPLLLPGVGDPDERHGEGEEVVLALARVARAGRRDAAGTDYLGVGLAQAR